MNNGKKRAALPTTGLGRDEVLSLLGKSRLDPVKGHWSRAFRPTQDVQELSWEVYREFLSDNGIFSYRLPYMKDIEQEVLQMCTSLLHGSEDSAGNMTSGGSESIYSALHAMREWAREARPGARSPNVVVPYSAHPTFSKGCHYLGLELKRIPLGSDYRADVEAMAAAIDSNTIGLAGSAPCWPYALYDPISEIAALAGEHDLWMHVDACVGGYLAPFVHELGYRLPDWDFSVAGVSSISADLHKYGYCPKPCSTILWRDASLQRFHYVHPDDWPGGQYSTSGFAGTRVGGAIFAAWAVMNHLGHDGYLRMAHRVMDSRAELVRRIDMIEGLEAWDTDLLPLPVRGTTVDIGRVSAALMSRGHIVLGTKEPPLLNLPIDPALDATVKDAFLAELEAVTMGILDGSIDAGSSLTYG